ncbi:hypothetical protein AcV5_002117 [Taiwanofungus camphoratus]|nr:hypothetical protein AcV5_002117 [Antrodia cinnamomea]
MIIIMLLHQINKKNPSDIRPTRWKVHRATQKSTQQTNQTSSSASKETYVLSVTSERCCHRLDLKDVACVNMRDSIVRRFISTETNLGQARKLVRAQSLYSKLLPSLQCKSMSAKLTCVLIHQIFHSNFHPGSTTKMCRNERFLFSAIPFNLQILALSTQGLDVHGSITYLRRPRMLQSNFKTLILTSSYGSSGNTDDRLGEASLPLLSRAPVAIRGPRLATVLISDDISWSR